jgi:hypothetical protein
MQNELFVVLRAATWVIAFPVTVMPSARAFSIAKTVIADEEGLS